MSEVISELQHKARRALTLNAEVFTQEVLALLHQDNDPTAELWQMLFKANRLRYVNAAEASEYLRAVAQHERYAAGTLLDITTQHMQFLIDSEHVSITDRLAGLDRFRSRYLNADFAFGDAIVDLQVGHAFVNANQPADALRLYQQALAKFELFDDELMSAEAKSQISHALFIAGFDHGADDTAFKQCLQLLGEVQEVYTRYDVPTWTTDVLQSIANLHFVMNDYASALSVAHQALAICERVAREQQTINERMDTTSCMSQIAMIHVKARNLDTARTYALAALEMCPPSHPEAYGECLERLGVIDKWEGNAEQALEYYQKAIDLADEHGMLNKPIRHLNLAHCLLALGRVAEARIAKDVAMQSPHFVGHQATAWASIIQAQILMHDGDIVAAKKLVDDYLEHHSTDRHLWEQIEAHLVLRAIAQQQTDFAAYLHHNERVVTLTEQLRGTKKLQGLATMEHERSVEGEREEARRHKAILYSTLPKHIADRVARGEVVNDHYENAAVMFLDIVGFTTISSTLTSQQVTELLDAVFGICDAACKQHNITRIKTIGDSFLAVGGLEEEKTREPVERIANAALQIIEQVKQIDFESLRVRIGLHCGPVTAGIIGTDRLQYDVWGDTVNVASRMESTSEAGKIHISEQFANALSPLSEKERGLGESSRKKEGEGLGESSRVEGESSRVEGESSRVAPRGTLEIKGKGSMTTYWLTS